MNMRHLDLHSGYPFWLLRDGIPYDYPKLDQSLKVDVIVLGGGISGALMAYYLTQSGLSAAVVDARSIGIGSTCASTGLLQYEIDTPLVRLRKMVGERDAFRSYELCAESILTLDEIARTIGFTGFSFKSSLYFAAFRKDLNWMQEEYKLRKEAGFKVGFLSQEEVKSIYSFSSPGAIFSELGGQIDAYAITHALLQYCMAKGLKVYDRTVVANIEHTSRKVILQTDYGHQITAGKIVYATGYEAVNQIDKKFVDLHSTFAVASEQENGFAEFWQDNCMLWNTARPYLYARTTSDNRIVVGGRDVPFLNAKRRDGLLGYKCKLLSKDFSRLFPHIRFKPEFSWAGTFGVTQDGLPFIGSYKGLKNSYFALGFGGNGITFSIIAAQIISDLIAGKSNKDASVFRFERI